MPVKEEIKLGPERLGLSERDIMYLLIFRELHNQSASPSDIFEVVRAELSNIQRGRARSYFYNVVNQMESFGWITSIRTENKNNKKYYAITADGYAKIDSFKESCMDSMKSLKSMADHFDFHISGTGKSEPIQLNTQQRKMFNRLINVRHLIRYLFLKILTEDEHRQESGKKVWLLFKERYEWQPAQGYYYEVLREMEVDQGYVTGKWTTDRRSTYIYQITSHGLESIASEAETTLHFVRQLQHYTRFILNLFPDRNS
ncbi:MULTISPECIES: helix-turn-helix transcriptional regulator [unclassified Paenibacillus]|uniref:helix-turn-helix transcriptional regulator n=1 Tax=unclassified Paenibacillus TaxID=185978 RepID=UPI000C2730C6|nr:helix-turn-helix transcriptional regulator [Paenibacillus sp. GM1FR]PJN64558.1 hypothetical protein PAEAM_06440 [Paenibacillus sp. GM1FR]